MAQFVQDGVVYEDLGNGNVRVVGYADAPQGQPAPMTIGSPKPKDAPSGYRWGANGELIAIPGGPADKPTDNPNAPKLPTGYRWKPDGTAELIPGVAAPGAGNKATAAQRTEAIQGFNDAVALRNIAKQLRERFEQGPGTTQGIAALQDFLPTAANRGFDTAAQRARGYVKRSLGFTGGEGNTVAESTTLYDPYLPSTSDYDSSILDKIAALEELAGLAEGKAVAVLGGRPDASGNVVPITQDQQAPMLAPAGNVPPAPQGPDRSNPLPTGPSFGGPQGDPSGFVPYGSTTRRVNNPEWAGVNEAVKGMIIAGQTPDQIRAYLGQRGINTNVEGLNQAADYFRKTGKRDFRVNVDDIEVPMSGFEQFRNNAPQTAVGAGLTTAANAASFGIPQALAPEQMQYIRDQSPVASFVGDVAGIVGATSGIGAVGNSLARSLAPRALTGGGRLGNAARAIAPDAVYGAAYGGITEGDPLTGAATATLGSGAGQVIGKGGQKLFQGVTDPGVQYLSARGIPMTPGQILGNESRAGRFVQGIESMPYIGPAFGQRKIEGLQAFNREAMNDAVAPVGGRVTAFGPDGLQQAQDAVSQGYRNALDGVNISPDAQFAADAQAAMQAGAAVPKFGEDFTYMMGREVDPVLNGGILSGPQLQSALQSIGRVRSSFTKNPDAMANYAADAAGQMDDAVTGLVTRQAPDVMPAYNNAKQAFQSLAPIENASISAVNSGAGQGVFTPRQLARSISTNTKNYGGRAAAARGDNLTDLVRYSQAVLPDTVPNSGTADRIASLLVPTALGGTAAGVSLLSPEWAVPIATLAALTSKPGQALTQAALVKRPAAIRRAGGIFGRRKLQKGLGASVVTAPLLIEQ